MQKKRTNGRDENREYDWLREKKNRGQGEFKSPCLSEALASAKRKRKCNGRKNDRIARFITAKRLGGEKGGEKKTKGELWVLERS